MAQGLALRLLALQPGDRFDAVGALAAQFGTGRGTVQSALKLLTAEGAVALSHRGSLGSFVSGLDYLKLLEIAGLSPIIGVMALPYSLHFKGLAVGLTSAFDRAGLPLALAHMGGGKRRLHFLRSGRCSFTVISRLAWQEEAAQGDLELLFTFGPGSNMSQYSLLLSNPEATGIADGMRVGVDPSSHDHMRLTGVECQGKAVTLVTTSYAQLLGQLQRREIDAAIWDAGVPVPPSLSLLQVGPQVRELPDDPNTEAVLVALAENGPLGRLLARAIDPALVRAIQQEVVTGERVAAF